MKRIPSLDGFRGLCILAVLAAHFAYDVPHPEWVTWVTGTLAHYGVVVFFVISGYLITEILQKKPARSEFYKRRALRILPLAYLYLGIMAAVHWRQLSGFQLGMTALYMSSYLSHLPWYLSHLWSLSCEEQFYLLWPLRVSKSVAWACILVAPVVRYWTGHHGYYMAEMFSFPANVDAIAAGCLLSLYKPRFAFKRLWPALFLIPLVAHYRGGNFLPTVFLGVLLAVLNGELMNPGRFMNWRPLAWVGTLSYSLYVFSMPFADPGWNIPFWFRIAGTFLVPLCTYYFFEKPILSLRFYKFAWSN